MEQYEIDKILKQISGSVDRTKEKQSEIQFQYCPFCDGGGKDKWTFAISKITGAYNCKRSSCDAKGSIYDLAKEFGIRIENKKDYNQHKIKKPKKDYTKLMQPKYGNQEQEGPAWEYMRNRGISQEICERYHITTMKDKPDVIVFPFHDEYGKLQFVKYRDSKYQKGSKGNKEWCQTNCKPILFGMEQCEGYDSVVITEGQIDSLSVAEAGIKNAVSVPTGALGFTWVEHCYEWLLKFKEIIIFGDNENGDITLVDGIYSRFKKKKIKVVRPQDYNGCKDANEILQKENGKENILNAVQKAELIQVDKVVRLAEVELISTVELEHIKTGIKNLDEKINGLYMGNLIVVTGKRGQGKSTLCSQMMAQAIEQGYNVFAYSGELPTHQFKDWFQTQVAGADNIVHGKVKPYANRCIDEWYGDKAYIYDINATVDEDEEEAIVEMLERVISVYDAKFILVDNLMTAMDEIGTDIYNQQGNFVKKLKKLALGYNVAIILVVHPRKNQGGNKFDCDDIAGSTQITDRADIVLTVSKDNNHTLVEVLKNRLNGNISFKDEPEDNKIKLKYDKTSRRLYEKNESELSFSWGETKAQDVVYVNEKVGVFDDLPF